MGVKKRPKQIQRHCVRKGQSYFVKTSKNLTIQKFFEADIITMLECLIDNIFAMFCGRVFHQTFSILIGTYSGLLLGDLFFYEVHFIRGNSQKKKKKQNRPARSFNFMFRLYDIYHVLPVSNSTFGYYVDRIYPIELEIKDNI